MSPKGGGKQGFQTPIANDSFIVDGVGALGNMHQERGLTYFEVALSGHMCVCSLPRSAPRLLTNAHRRYRVPQFSPVVSRV